MYFVLGGAAYSIIESAQNAPFRTALSRHPGSELGCQLPTARLLSHLYLRRAFDGLFKRARHVDGLNESERGEGKCHQWRFGGGNNADEGPMSNKLGCI